MKPRNCSKTKLKKITKNKNLKFNKRETRVQYIIKTKKK